MGMFRNSALSSSSSTNEVIGQVPNFAMASSSSVAATASNISNFNDKKNVPPSANSATPGEVLLATLGEQCASTWRWIRSWALMKMDGDESTNNEDGDSIKQPSIRISHSLPDLNHDPGEPVYNHPIETTQGKKVLRQITMPSVPTRHQTFQRQLSHRLEFDGIEFKVCKVKPRNQASIGEFKPELYSKELQKQTSTESNENPESMQYCGKLHFTLRYDFELDALIIKVLDAFELPIKDMTGSSDPYVKVFLLPDRKKKFQTKVHRKNLNPVFNETFIVSVNYDELLKRHLQFSVYDFDRFSRHDLIGQVVLKNLMDETDLRDETEYTMNILCPPQDKLQLGEIMLSLCYLPTAGRLTATVVKARHLKAMDITGSSGGKSQELYFLFLAHLGSHYLALPSQGNIYLSAKFRKKDGTNKMFVASARRKVYLVEYQSLDDYLEPVTKEIPFAYTSSGTEIFALDVLNRSRDYDNIVVGLIIIKNADGNNNVLLNLYSDYNLETNDVILETIGQSCESFVLDYISYGLYHVELPPRQINGAYENVWLIPGHDQKIRTYRNYYSERCHREITTNEFFPELEGTPSIVLSMEFLYYNEYHNRVTCLGCENGHVRCSIVDCDNNSVLKNLFVEYENPVSNVQLFTLSLSKMSLDQFLKTEDPALLDENPEINLLVVNSLYHSEVFMNIINFDLKKRHCLYENLLNDVCLCSTVADIDFDGNKEIIIGTYCEELILFKYMEETWKCVDRKPVQNPIHSLYYEDMTDDGVSDLVIVTSKGLHVYQHKLKQNTLNMLEDRMNKIDTGDIIIPKVET